MSNIKNFSSFVLENGIFSTNTFGENAIINEIVCIEPGQIEIIALGGGFFTWTSEKNKKIEILTNCVKINNGIFLALFTQEYNYNHSLAQDTYWIDESRNMYVDENEDFYTLI